MESLNTDKSIEFNNFSLEHLNEIRKWALFLSICGFIFVGACLVLTPFLLSSAFSSSLPGRGLFTTIPMMIITLIYFFPIYFLLMFSINSKKAINDSDGNHLQKAFKYLKFHYRFMGIFLIIMLCIYVILGVAFLIKFLIK
jgi:uncharacterized oligopeptide transporter (OPT) family protein